MHNFILFDDEKRDHLRPLTFFRPVSDLISGMFSIKTRWEMLLGAGISVLSEPYLSKAHPTIISSDNILINSRLLPTRELIEEITAMPEEVCLISDNQVVAYRLTRDSLTGIAKGRTPAIHEKEVKSNVRFIHYPWDLFSENGNMIRQDFGLITREKVSETIPPTCKVTGEQIFVEKDALIEPCNIDTTEGPVFIGRNAHIMQGANLRGPLSVGEHATVKMGANIYGNTTIGKHCKVGGEVSDTIFMNYSNKGHDGFIGHSVIGEWCNLGAGTIVSNLKNNYEKVRIWDYPCEKFIDSGLQFCGVIMGDHTKTGIHTMINSGTVIGVCCNIFGSGYQRNFIPSFQWGSNAGFRRHKLQEAIETAEMVYKRRNLIFEEIQAEIMKTIFEMAVEQKRI